MIFHYDNMRFANVVSKKYILKMLLLESAQKDFLTGLVNDNLKINGSLFYYIEAVEGDVFSVNFMIPIENNAVELERYDIFSYYGLEKTICTYVKVKDIDNTILLYENMQKFANTDGFKLCTPLYFVLGKNELDPYIIVHGGIAPL